MTPLQMRRVQEKRLRRRKRKKSKRNEKRLTSFDAAEFERAIANLPEQDQVLWMRFVMGSQIISGYPHEDIAYRVVRRQDCHTQVLYIYVDFIEVFMSPNSTCQCRFKGYQSHYLTTMDGIARAAVNGVRQYFKAVR